MSEFRIKALVLGEVSTNCYIIYNQTKKEAVIVDPADNGEYILHMCHELQVVPAAVLLTHGHFDHILAVKDVQRAFHCKVYAGREEERLLMDPYLNLSGSLDTEQVSLNADYLVRDGEALQLAGFEWKVIETPGHTSGSVCYYIEEEGVLVSGDTLFAGSLGRTDMPTGNAREIMASIRDKLLVLPEDTMVYPGHGEQTTIGYERKYNPVAMYYNRRR